MQNNNTPLIIALYLPQFYETDYNNKWWGKGYTEWVALKKAKPLYSGHKQPRIPLNNNYYDLSKKETIRWQINIAKEYGIDGFAIYQYYSCGSKLLEVPTEMIRDDSTLDLPFFLYWANQSWRKAWFGEDNTIVWEQRYGNESDWKKHFDYCLSFFRDERYIKINNKPVYAIYCPGDIPKQKKFIEAWNRWAKEEGFEGIYFIKTIGGKDLPGKGCFSATIRREPVYTMTHDENLIQKAFRIIKERSINQINKYFLMPRNKGYLHGKKNYDTIWKKILKRNDEDENDILGCFCDWDNSPRKTYNAIIMQGASVEKFKKYFSLLYKKACRCKTPMIVINAWNEWAEGAYLEPDVTNGYGYLESIRETVREKDSSKDMSAQQENAIGNYSPE